MRKGLVDGNYILPLDQYYDERKWPIFDWARTWSKIAGKTWEVPYEAQTHGLYYNKTALAKLGVEIRKTYDDVLAAAEGEEGRPGPVRVRQRQGHEHPPCHHDAPLRRCHASTGPRHPVWRGEVRLAGDD